MSHRKGSILLNFSAAVAIYDRLIFIMLPNLHQLSDNGLNKKQNIHNQETVSIVRFHVKASYN